MSVSADCDQSCVVLDDGFPGCAVWNHKTHKRCWVYDVYYNGQWVGSECAWEECLIAE